MLRFNVLLSCFVLLLVQNTYATPSCEKNNCIAVVDAGSTGSRLHIFAYETDTTSSPINITELWTKKITPGIAKVEANKNTLDAYFTTLFADAPKQKMPVYFYATAGMRLLPPSRQKKYYEELNQWFANRQQWQLADAKTITGHEEALYDWLAVNYHIGAFKNKEHNTVGVMDMGGASVQIVFPIEENPRVSPKSQVQLDLYGRHFNLFVHSFLGLGQIEMSHQFLNSPSCYANNFPLPDGAIGQGNAASCEQEVSSLMNAVHGVDHLVQPLLSENPVKSWYAIGGISNFADSSLFNFDKGQLTNQNLLQQGDSQVCHQQWDALNEQFPNDDYVYQYCLFSAYFYALMVDGYGLYPEQAINYIAPDKGLDWTLGVVVHHKD